MMTRALKAEEEIAYEDGYSQGYENCVQDVKDIISTVAAKGTAGLTDNQKRLLAILTEELYDALS